MAVLTVPMGAIMRLCYQWVNQYGVAILLFAILTKALLFPVSLWVHANGIRMVRIQAAVNRLKIKYFGDKDRIADEQAALFKKERYSPFAGVVPIFVQLLLLIGLIQVVYHPITAVLGLPGNLAQEILQTAQTVGGVDIASSSAEMLALDSLQRNAAAFADLPGMTPDVMARLSSFDMRLAGLSLAGVPATEGGALILIPLLAAAASVVLSLSQNVMNPLQAQQGKLGQYGSMAFSVGISLVVGFFVPGAVGFYWILSNLLTIAQQALLNAVYPPAKRIDYAELEASKQELAKYQNVGGRASDHDKQHAKREKADYKRFFSIANKHLVFYSESNGFYKYFERIIEYLLNHTNLTIHYVTSDPDDQIFTLAQSQPKIKPYYIGEKKLITLLMKLEADVVVMTMSDLGNYHYKRSYMRPDIEYVYVFHYPLSTHMVLHTGALDHYDTILCVGAFQFVEIRKTEALYGLPEKKLIACGYGQLEKLSDAYSRMPRTPRDKPKVLIAPSWQADNILDSCIDELLAQVLSKGFSVVVRPHPEYVKRYPTRMDDIVARYAAYEGGDLSFELDFTSNASLFDSDIVISDWSGSAYEFAFVTGKPCLLIDTPPKIHNPEYVKLNIEPLEFSLRDQIGVRVSPDNLEGLAERLRALMAEPGWQDAIFALRAKYIANFGNSGEVGGKYILGAIQDKIKLRAQSND